MNIYLIRHGQSQGNVDKAHHLEVADHAIGLSDLGHQQAYDAGVRLGEHLKGRYGGLACSTSDEARVWVSPYHRTRWTAESMFHGMMDTKTWGFIRDVREHPLLVEQQYGLFDGIPDEELPVRFPNEHAHYEKCERFQGKFWARMPLGESRFDVSVRVHQAFGTFHRDAQKHGIRNIVIVSHGTTIRAFVMMWLHLPYEWFEDEPNPKNGSIRWISDNKDMGYL